MLEVGHQTVPQYYFARSKVTSLLVRVAVIKLFVEATNVELVISSDFLLAKITQASDYSFTKCVC